MEQLIIVFGNWTIVLVAIFATILLVGVVWRVEKGLDVSFKLFTISIIFFIAYQIISFLILENQWLLEFLIMIFKLLFVTFFLGGSYAMNRVVDKFTDRRERP